MNILIVAAHADDEALGCGGTMARHAAEGDKVHVVFLADGESSRREGNEAAVAERRKTALSACAALGAETPTFAGFADNRLDSVALLDVVQALEKVIAEVEPEVVYTHHGGDLNVDHRVAHQAVITACRPQPGATVKAIYTFEVPSSTEWASPESDAGFRPVRFVDIAAYLDAKSRALEIYRAEMRPFPHARSLDGVLALARVRGTSAGFEAGEAFMVVRELVG